MQVEHKIVKQIDEMSEHFVHNLIKTQDYETYIKFKTKAKAKAEEIINKGEQIYDLDYFLEYIFLPQWEN